MPWVYFTFGYIKISSIFFVRLPNDGMFIMGNYG